MRSRQGALAKRWPDEQGAPIELRLAAFSGNAVHRERGI
jgi:hypothetical protein